jgi:nicotinamidase-related amidase
MTPLPLPALVVIDVQKAIDDPRWSHDGPRNHARAESRIANLLLAWRERRLPLFHIRYDPVEPGSSYRPGQPGHDFKPEAAPLAGETVIGKYTPDAFIGTDLEARLRATGAGAVVLCGVTTNNSVEATARHAGCLGFGTYVVEDACCTYARKDWRGRVWDASDVHALSLANLSSEYARIITTHEALALAREPHGAVAAGA